MSVKPGHEAGFLTGSKTGRLLVLVVIFLVASAFRFIGLDNFPSPLNATPPGLEHDEVAHWLINRDILAGEHAVYFTEAYGHEALYHYLQAYFGALVGDHALALRLPSAYFGVMLVAVSYALSRRMFGRRVAMWSAAFLAVLFWPVFYSRLALRAISLPVFSGLAAWFWWRAWGGELEQGRNNIGEARNPPLGSTGETGNLIVNHKYSFIFSGFFAGLSLHTYMAARAVPIFFALYTVYLLLFHRPVIHRHRQGLAVFWFAVALVAAPLALFLLTNPGAEARITEVDAPLRAFLAGDARPVLSNAVKIAGMFIFRGDPLWRQNIAGRPVFDPALGGLFFLGLLLCLRRWRDARHAFLLLWLVASVIPSLVTVDAPSSIRIINLLPVLMLFPLIVIHNNPYLSTIRDNLSTNLITRATLLGLSALLVIEGLSTVQGLWRVWPANDEVRFVWQAALTEAAAYLDGSPQGGVVAVGGWTPATMDPPTMDLTLRRDDLSLRYFDPTQSVIIPTSPAGQPIRIVTPTILPIAPMINRIIALWARPMGEFTLYELPARLDVGPSVPADVDFGGQLRFLGYDTPDGCAPGGPCTLVTYWQVTAAADGPRRLFLHAVDASGEVIAQDDRLGAPAEHWQPGDILIQQLTLPESTAELRLGVYNPNDRRRLLAAGEEFIVIGR